MYIECYPSKHKTSAQHLCKAGPTPKTLGRRRIDAAKSHTKASGLQQLCKAGRTPLPRTLLKFLPVLTGHACHVSHTVAHTSDQHHHTPHIIPAPRHATHQTSTTPRHTSYQHHATPHIRPAPRHATHQTSTTPRHTSDQHHATPHIRPAPRHATHQTSTTPRLTSDQHYATPHIRPAPRHATHHTSITQRPVPAVPPQTSKAYTKSLRPLRFTAGLAPQMVNRWESSTSRAPGLPRLPESSPHDAHPMTPHCQSSDAGGGQEQKHRITVSSTLRSNVLQYYVVLYSISSTSSH